MPNRERGREREREREAYPAHQQQPRQPHHHHILAPHHHHQRGGAAGQPGPGGGAPDFPPFASSAQYGYPPQAQPQAAPQYGNPPPTAAATAQVEQARIAMAQQVQQQTATTAALNALPPRVPLVDRDIFMLSLPSQDSPSYYDPPSDSDSVTSNSSVSPPLTTNRGHKLLSSAPHARRGRLGDYPHTDAGFVSSSSVKRLKTLSGYVSPSQGFNIAPNLHLVRPPPTGGDGGDIYDLPPAIAVLPPPPQTPLDLLMSSSIQYTLGKKNRTLHTLALSATGLIEQEAPLIFNLSRVCEGLRGEGFEMRWDGDEERKRAREIEDELERVEEEEEEERRRKREFERMEEKREEERKENERLEKIEEERNRVFEEGRKARRDQERKDDEEREKLFLELKQAEDDAALAATEAKAALELKLANEAALVPLPPADVPVDDPIPSISTDIPVPVLESGDIPVNAVPAPLSIDPLLEPAQLESDVTMANAEPELPVPSTSTTVATPSGGTTADVPVPTLDESSLPPLPINVPLDPSDIPVAMEVDSEAPPDAEGEAGGDPDAVVNPTEDEAAGSPAVRRRSGRVAQRVVDPNNRHRSTSDSEESDDDERRLEGGEGGVVDGSGVAAGIPVDENGVPGLRDGEERPIRVVEEELPEYARRMVDPEIYVRSLFVSSESVEMPVPLGAAPGNELISPNEQEVVLHDCLTDLHRFLADSLEYRARLSEIRDGILGAERRRKGMWKVLRMVAADWLEEETQAQENE